MKDDETKARYVDLYMKGLYRENLVDFGDAIIRANFVSSRKDHILYNLAERAYSRDLAGGARLARAIENPDIRHTLTKQIKFYASTQGPEIEKRVKDILGRVDK